MPSQVLLLLGLTSLVGLSLAQSCQGAWKQCGGKEYTGVTTCCKGYKCSAINDYYSQCTASGDSTGGTSASGTDVAVVSPTGPLTYTTTISSWPSPSTRSQSAYPTPTGDTCGAWKLVDGACCPNYCSTDLRSESCSSSCSGSCTTPPSAMCKSGNMYPEVRTVKNSTWHYSRSTHFGLTSGGACGFGLYGLCTKGSKTASWTDPWISGTCDSFCKAYPTLCKDPSDRTLRGNFAAPNGDYYTQFWPTLVGDRDNYLSCGECFELVRTKKDGTEYAVGETGYTEPIVLEVVDSCPCSANSKWCCGPGADHCAEIDFKYGCPLPTDSIHLDLSDIAMGRLQGNGSLTDGVIPTRYRRVPCPKPGNAYAWLRDGGGQYWFALSIVNTNGPGSVVSVEIKGAGSDEWVAMVHDPNYTSSRPQERYGSWVNPQGSGPFPLPIAMRLTSPTGEQIVNERAIKSFTPSADAPTGFYYVDLGVQFTIS